MNSSPRSWSRPSIVTTRSFIACSSAACVFGGVRLISSARRSCVKIGPLVRVKLLLRKSKRLVPSTSPGMRSGVNWMRPKSSARPAAKACVSSVFAVPGTPSMRTWPPTRRLVSMKSTASSCPTTALQISPRSRSVIARMSSTSIENAPLPLMGFAHDRDQLGGIAPPLPGGVAGTPVEVGAVDRDAARLADAAQPEQERLLRHAARRMKLLRHLADRRLDVALDDDPLMPGEFEQPRRILHERVLAGAEGRRGGLGRAEPPQRRPEQQQDGK